MCIRDRSRSWPEMASDWSSGTSSFANMRRRSNQWPSASFQMVWAYPRRRKDAPELWARLPEWG
eukprot:1731284-Alexandrium_andersonii.AAC.1